mmetsp:Transcript_29227/g.67073  ORF Transcript_29227/g.67073 Transcript_29227/m.67073 type:complete len:459 (-) Transcript_29227:271-1647(-)
MLGECKGYDEEFYIPPTEISSLGRRGGVVISCLHKPMSASFVCHVSFSVLASVYENPDHAPVRPHLHEKGLRQHRAVPIEQPPLSQPPPRSPHEPLDRGRLPCPRHLPHHPIQRPPRQRESDHAHHSVVHDPLPLLRRALRVVQHAGPRDLGAALRQHEPGVPRHQPPRQLPRLRSVPQEEPRVRPRPVLAQRPARGDAKGGPDSEDDGEEPGARADGGVAAEARDVHGKGGEEDEADVAGHDQGDAGVEDDHGRGPADPEPGGEEETPRDEEAFEEQGARPDGDAERVGSGDEGPETGTEGRFRAAEVDAKVGAHRVGSGPGRTAGGQLRDAGAQDEVDGDAEEGGAGPVGRGEGGEEQRRVEDRVLAVAVGARRLGEVVGGKGDGREDADRPGVDEGGEGGGGEGEEEDGPAVSVQGEQVRDREPRGSGDGRARAEGVDRAFAYYIHECPPCDRAI